MGTPEYRSRGGYYGARAAKWLIASLALILFPGVAAAQSDAQLWVGGSASGKLSGPISGSVESIARLSDNRGGLYEVESSTALGYRLAPNATLWAGFVYDPLFSHGHKIVTEYRFRQQLNLDNVVRIAGGSLSARLRVEQRWRDTATGAGWRVRPILRFTLPVARKSPTMFVLSHESFVDLNTTAWGQRGGYDRMRNFAGISTPICPGVRVEIGYLEQHGVVANGPDTDDHTLLSSLAYSF